MSEQAQPAPRKPEEIRPEYTQFAARLGEALYKKTVIEGEISAFTHRMGELNREASEYEAQAKASAPVVVEVPKVVEGEIVP